MSTKSEVAEAMAKDLFPDVKNEEARCYLCSLVIEAIESWIECNRAKTLYYGHRYVRED